MSALPELAVKVSDLVHVYPAGQMALDHISFSIAVGERVGLVGPNGAGKTTLFLCLAGVLGIRSGSIVLAGLDPTDPTQRKRLPQHVGIVFQNSDDQLFNSTVFDDVAFGPLNLGLMPAEVRQRVTQSLERVGLAGFDARVPYHLSGGEKRRAAIAGILAMRPDVLLLDEPSMYLDPRGRRELIQLVNGLSNTKLIASHDLEMILQTCTRAILLDRGRIVADGAVRELFGNQTLMETHGLEVPHSLTPHSMPHHGG